jgi:beta-glucuronidase
MKLIFSLLFLPATCFSQELLINTANRNTTSLNGHWNYVVDPYETGYQNFHSEIYDQKNPASPAAFYNHYRPKDPSELVEYDFDKSPWLAVPGDWNTQKENLLYYEGTLWLKRSFDYTLKHPNRLFLYFGAVNYKAEVYLNGIKLGMHEGGFTPFQFEVTSIVKPAANYLVVKVNNTRFSAAVPPLQTDWWNHGGITRDVLLIEEPQHFVQDYRIQLKNDAGNTIAGFVKLSRAAAGQEITISIPELKTEKTITTSDNGTAQFEFRADKIRYWSPESPVLYEVVIRTATQSLRDQIGFRTIRTNGPDILLNGKPVFLKGISIHEEIYGRRATGPHDALALLSWAKELGCNFVRLAHYPHNEHMIRMADRMGLLVWEEIPVYWTVDFANEATLRSAKSQLTEMITRDKNRACVIIWSVANETPVSDARNTFLKNLVQQARTTDPTRLISAALLTRSENGVNMVDDEIGGHFDIVAFNQYRGWYGGDLETAPAAIWKIPFNKPVVVSEFGGDALFGLHGEQTARWTEEYQDYLYRQNLRMIENMPNIRGISPWILADFRSPRRFLPGIQDGFNRKGLISDRGEKKKAFFTLQAFYRRMGN